MSLVSDILTDALNYIGANAAGETPDTDDQGLSLRVANRMLDSWSAKKLSLVTGVKVGTYTLSGAASYTYGTGQTWNGSRPIKIKSAASVAANGTVMPIHIATAEEWAKIVDKTRTGIFVEDLYYDDATPSMVVYVTPMPAAGSVQLFTYEAITAFATWGSTVTLYPGMERALVTVLAFELCLPFGRPVPDELPQLAAEALNTVISLWSEISGQEVPAVPTTPAAQGTAA